MISSKNIEFGVNSQIIGDVTDMHPRSATVAKYLPIRQQIFSHRLSGIFSIFCCRLYMFGFFLPALFSLLYFIEYWIFQGISNALVDFVFRFHFQLQMLTHCPFWKLKFCRSQNQQSSTHCRTNRTIFRTVLYHILPYAVVLWLRQN